MSQRFYNPLPHFLDSTPSALSGAKLFFYQSGTSTKLDTFSDEALGVANTNPIVLNSAGRPSVNVFLQNLPYKVVLAPDTDTDPPTSPIWSSDPVATTDFKSVVITKVGSGSPNGVVAGTAGSAGVLPTMYWDTVAAILYVCTTTGSAAAAVWTALNAAAATPVAMPPQGYLTVSGGEPILTADAVASTIVYYTPFIGNQVPIYNGTRFVPTEFSQLSLTLHSSHAADTIYDVFVFSNSGVLTLVTLPAWATSTAGSGARGSTGTQIARVQGVWVNSVQATGRNGATTYTVGANLATYLGSIVIDGSAGQVTCHVDYGSTRRWAVWNAYNRQPIVLRVGSTATYQFTGTQALRVVAADNGNTALPFRGIADEPVDVTFKHAFTITASNATISATINIGVDSVVSVGNRGSASVTNPAVSALAISSEHQAQHVIRTGLGVNTVYQLESGTFSATGADRTIDFFGSEGSRQMLVKYRG